MSTRRLAAILAADVVGFSKLIGEDEAGTLAALREIRRGIVNPILAEHGGRIFKLMGDGMLAEFPSAVQALRAAIGIQEKLRQRNREGLPGNPIEVRIGLHQGDVVVEGTDLLGDGVNIAARLESLAKPGGICISGRVHEDAAGKIMLQADDLGEQSLKNISRPVRAYRLWVGSSQPANKAIPDSKSPLALPDKPSVAVLPFQNMSGDPEQEYFADGITSDVITELSTASSFFVIAKTSSFQYRDADADVRRVAAELGSQYVLQGSVRRGGERLRLTAQLIDASSGKLIWADKFDGVLQDTFDLQDRLSSAIVGAIEPNVTVAEVLRSRSKPTENLTAYDHYLRALSAMSTLQRATYEKAIKELRASLNQDPDYADALSLLAVALGHSTHHHWLPRDPTYSEILNATRRAVQAGPNSPTVLSLAAYAEAVYGGSWDRSDEFAEAALRLAPNSAAVRLNCGLAAAFGGASSIALEHLRAALRLSPRDIQAHRIQIGMAIAHFFATSYDEAEKWCWRIIQDNSDHVPARRYLAAVLGHLGRIEEGQQIVAQILKLAPGSSLNLAKRTPFRHAWQTEMYVEGQRRAGLPQT
jgi:adenylate cyclase